jgi:EAL domain-containing protein (putative c-di-GMP-specific phosphodiesterase class I)
MPSSTRAHATPRFLLRHPTPSERGPYLGLADPRERELCSPAGLYRRPWLARLRRALAEDLFVVHYQPIVSLADGQLYLQEALVRLDDAPGGRVVAPGAFLPAAERHGLIRSIDRLVLEKVIARLGSDAGAGATRVAVNLSALSVTDAGMLTHIERLLARWRVDPAQLVIELTETSAISDMRRAKAFCAGAEALGCAIALDDFGAGFGSFQYLRHLPFRYLKIDGDFIRALTTSTIDQLVVSALAQLVSAMGRETIAEFVADRATLAMVAELGVDYAQGYEVGPPVAELAIAVQALPRPTPR